MLSGRFGSPHAMSSEAYNGFCSIVVQGDRFDKFFTIAMHVKRSCGRRLAEDLADCSSSGSNGSLALKIAKEAR
jgi:hypothetical protein